MDKQGPGSWYFGWNIVGAATVLTLLTVGLRMGIGPFFLPMTQTLGFSRSELSASWRWACCATAWPCRWPATWPARAARASCC